MSNITYTNFQKPTLVVNSEEQYYYVSAFCPKFGDHLVVNKFDWDWSCAEAEHYKEQALLMAEAFVQQMNSRNQLTVRFELTEQMFKDILDTAWSGGIDYWVGATQVVDGVRQVQPDDEKTWYPLTREGFIAAIQQILDMKRDHNPTRNSIESAIAENDAGHIDAEGADWIVQLACFGEVVYG